MNNNDCQKRPMVSVVMIAYNMERYISQAIKGVVRQRTDFPVELIVMDDCSTDSTATIVKEWKAKHPYVVKYHRNARNLGLQRNYLEGFKLCTGKYMAICDADDYWIGHGKLQRMVDYMENHPQCAVAFHRVVNYYEATGEKSLSNGGMVADCDVAALSRSNFITNSSVLYRRGLVDLTALPEWIKDDRSPDYAMHLLYARHGSIHFFSRPMGVYRKCAGSSWSMTDRFARLRMSLSVRMRLLDEFADDIRVTEGLLTAIKAILASMRDCMRTEQEREYFQNAAAEAGVNVADLPPVGSAPKRSLVSRIRAAVSRFIPLPK